MSTSSALSGRAYSRTASTVSCPNGSSPSISGTSCGHAIERTRAPASSVRTSASYRPDSTVAFVASRPIRRFRVACTAAWASGVITPTTGTESDSWSSGSAAAVAELHATRISFTPCSSRYEPISWAKRATSGRGRGPYGSRAPSPR